MQNILKVTIIHWHQNKCHKFVLSFFVMSFSPALLGYNRHITLCKLKVNSVLIYTLNILRNDYHSSIN